MRLNSRSDKAASKWLRRGSTSGRAGLASFIVCLLASVSDEVQTTKRKGCHSQGGALVSTRLQMASVVRRTMTDEDSGEAVITLDAAGHYVDANPAALRLLGVSLAELRVSAPDRFAMRPATDAEQAALRSPWGTTGAPPLVGTAG